ncbi:MAG: D-Ala-D-Ala carboxypeptidase family metallohydrolase [Actinomycetota bacterium]
MTVKRVTRGITIVLAATVVVVLAAPGAQAYDFQRQLKVGKSGRDVRALQIRIAGWYPTGTQETFIIDGSYGGQTKSAMKSFEAAYGRPVNGRASKGDLQVLQNLQSADGSTKHFDYSEFHQNSSSSCSAMANSYAGSFGGGRSSPRRVKRNVKRLMWRLEAVRKKGGSKPVGINSGFRSVPYNDCIGGARASQHLYGTAADNRMVGVDNHKERKFARKSQVHGIACYSSMSHNHFDLRIENKDLEAGHFWWWPEKDGKGRELAEDGRPCWGEAARVSASFGTQTQLALTTNAAVLRAVQEALPGAGSLVPTSAEIELFEAAGEADDLGGQD